MDHVIYGKGQAKLNVCGCGKLCFTYGPITLHFDRDEFQMCAEVVGRVAAQIPYVENPPSPLTIAPTSTDTICN